VDREKVRALLEAVAAGDVSPEHALGRLRNLPVEDLRFARVDVHRSLRHGVPEAVFCQGKTPEQVVAIVRRLAEAGVLAAIGHTDAGYAEAAAALERRCRPDRRGERRHGGHPRCR